MSTSYLFCLRKFPTTYTIRRTFGVHVALRLPSTAYSIEGATLATSSSTIRGASIEPLPPSHRRLSCVGARAIDWPQRQSSAAPSNLTAGLHSKAKRYQTDRKATQVAALHDWKTWLSLPNFRRRQINQHFGLWYVFRIVNELLFYDRLDSLVVLRWVDGPIGKLEQLSRTTFITDVKRGPYALIELTRPLRNGPLSEEVIQERLEAMLYEMTGVYSLLFISRGQSGNGPLCRQFLQRVQDEANHTLSGFSRQWQLKSSRR